MKTVVIFGATGTIGAYAALELRRKEYHVVAAGRRKSDNGFFSDYGIDYRSADISDASGFDCLPKDGIDHIVHFAGAMPAHMRGYDAHEYVNTIVNGTVNVLAYARSVHADRIVFSHSIADVLYRFGGLKPIPAEADRKFPLTGDHSVYSICKNAAVDLIEHYFAAYGLKRFVLRLPTIYAYHPNPFYYVDGRKKWMGFRFIMDKAVKGEPVEIWGDPESKKEIVYVKDFTQIVQKALEADCCGGVYNVGRGVGVSMEEQVRGILEVLSHPDNKSKVIYKPDMPSSPQFILDVSKTRTELGYVPQYDYLTYLRDFKEEMRIQRFAKLWGLAADYQE
jgi:nucleoside-diphosphate-sugar epimerase